MQRARNKHRNRTPENMSSFSESVSTLHAIGFKTLDRVHKSTIKQIRRSNTCIEQIIDREVVRQTINMKNEWNKSRCAVFLNNFHEFTSVNAWITLIISNQSYGTCKAERTCGNQSNRTARPSPRIVSQECMRLPNSNLLHNHPEVAIKNWALRWTDGGHRRNQNRRMNGRNHSNALLSIEWRCTGRGPARRWRLIP